jgi:hypothetical protein
MRRGRTAPVVRKIRAAAYVVCAFLALVVLLAMVSLARQPGGGPHTQTRVAPNAASCGPTPADSTPTGRCPNWPPRNSIQPRRTRSREGLALLAVVHTARTETASSKLWPSR